MKLDDLRQEFRAKPPARSCYICAWTKTRRPARFVMTGENGQWFDCGGVEHRNADGTHVNGHVIGEEDIEEWFRKHGLAEGKRAPETPTPVVEVFVAPAGEAEVDWRDPVHYPKPSGHPLADAVKRLPGYVLRAEDIDEEKAEKLWKALFSA